MPSLIGNQNAATVRSDSVPVIVLLLLLLLSTKQTVAALENSFFFARCEPMQHDKSVGIFIFALQVSLQKWHNLARSYAY